MESYRPCYGATHCLLPLKWLAPEQAAHSKRILRKVASGNVVRSLLYNNVMYCVTVSRPLISAGHLKATLDIRFIWSDSAPLLVVCSGGLCQGGRLPPLIYGSIACG